MMLLKISTIVILFLGNFPSFAEAGTPSCNDSFLPEMENKTLKRLFEKQIKTDTKSNPANGLDFAFTANSRTNASANRGSLRLFLRAYEERVSTHYQKDLNISEFYFMLRLIESDILSFIEGSSTHISLTTNDSHKKIDFNKAFNHLNQRELRLIAEENSQLFYINSQNASSRNLETKLTKKLSEFYNKAYEELNYINNFHKKDENLKVELTEKSLNIYSNELQNIEAEFFTRLSKLNRKVNLIPPKILKEIETTTVIKPRIYTKTSVLSQDWSTLEFQTHLSETGIQQISRENFTAKIESLLSRNRIVYLPAWVPKTNPTIDKNNSYTINFGKQVSFKKLRKNLQPQIYFVARVHFSPTGKMEYFEIQNTKYEGSLSRVNMDVDQLLLIYNIFLSARHMLANQNVSPLENQTDFIAERFSIEKAKSSPALRRPLPKEIKAGPNNKSKTKSYRAGSQRAKSRRPKAYKKKKNTGPNSLIDISKRKSENGIAQKKTIRDQKKSKLTERKNKKYLKHKESIELNPNEVRLENEIEFQKDTKNILERLSKSSKKLLKQKLIRLNYYKIINTIKENGFFQLKSLGGFHVEGLSGFKHIRSIRLTDSWRLFAVLVEKEEQRFFIPLHISNHNYEHEMKNTLIKIKNIETQGYTLK